MPVVMTSSAIYFPARDLKLDGTTAVEPVGFRGARGEWRVANSNFPFVPPFAIRHSLLARFGPNHSFLAGFCPSFPCLGGSSRYKSAHSVAGFLAPLVFAQNS